jgi:hypothetical protein
MTRCLAPTVETLKVTAGWNVGCWSVRRCLIFCSSNGDGSETGICKLFCLLYSMNPFISWYVKRPKQQRRRLPCQWKRPCIVFICDFCSCLMCLPLHIPFPQTTTISQPHCGDGIDNFRILEIATRFCPSSISSTKSTDLDRSDLDHGDQKTAA